MKLLKTFLVLSFCLLLAEETTNQNKKKFKDLFKNWNLGINGHIGQISPITSTDRSAFNPGRNIGISIQAPKPIKLFKQNFIYGFTINSSLLIGNTVSNKKINTISFDLKTKFKKTPLDFKFGFGVTKDSVHGIAGSGTIDIMHELSNLNDKLNCSIGIRFHQIFNVDENYKVEHVHSLYGILMNVGKSIKL